MKPQTSLQAWEANAQQWIGWARSADADHGFWRLNLPAFLDLLPAPRGQPTLDVGCGEGRLARELKKRGRRVIGLESSPSLAAAAREADPDFEVVLGDAAEMPFPDGAFELAVASLVLMNVDDMPAAVAEVSRVLREGGRFCFAILHPVNSWGDAGNASYFDSVVYEERIAAGDQEMTFRDTHRPLSAYFEALEAAGFLVEALREPRPSQAHAASSSAAARWLERPGFLHVRAVLPEHPPSAGPR